MGNQDFFFDEAAKVVLDQVVSDFNDGFGTPIILWELEQFHCKIFL